MKEQDSHISTGSKAEQPAGPTRQHHRLAVDEGKVNGMSNPNGASAGSTENKVGNAPCSY